MLELDRVRALVAETRSVLEATDARVELFSFPTGRRRVAPPAELRTQEAGRSDPVSARLLDRLAHGRPRREGHA